MVSVMLARLWLSIPLVPKCKMVNANGHPYTASDSGPSDLHATPARVYDSVTILDAGSAVHTV